MHPGLAVSISSGQDHPSVGARGGELGGIPVITSRNVASTVIALIDPTGIAYGEGPGELRTVKEGSYVAADTSTMTAAALGSPQTAVAAQLVSLWQTNTVAFVVGRVVNWARIRPNCVSVITGAAYT
jgi:hypothetical protein